MTKLLTTFIFIVGLVLSSSAATFIVNNNGDTNDANTGDNICSDLSGNCTLRAAIQQANASAGDDIISFNLPAPATINLTLGELSITSNLTITGLGARSLIINGNSNQLLGIFYIVVGANTTNIRGVTVANAPRCGINNNFGQLDLSEVTIRNNGTGICNDSILNVTRSTIHNNTSGGGIFHSSGNANISNTTISNNSNQTGGGIQTSSPSLTLNNVTISNNTATVSGGGLYYGGQNLGVFVRNTIIANNTAPNGADVFSRLGANGVTLASNGNNLIGVSDGTTGFINGINGDIVGTSTNPIDPLLGNLQNNGGETDTRALFSGSPAIDTGNNCVLTSTCPSNNPNQPLITDQRGTGFLRAIDGNLDTVAITDIGAFEYAVPLAANIEISGKVTTINDKGISNAVVKLTLPNGQKRYSITNPFGYYRFDNVAIGEIYIFDVVHKNYSFDTQVYFIDGAQTKINFTANTKNLDNNFLNRK